MRSLIALLIEPAMYAAIGFLAAALLSLPLFGVAHRRAERITRQRLDTLLPMSVKELEAEKDRLRAEHAMSAKRMETTLGDLRAKTASQQIALGRHGGAVARLKTELAAKTQAIVALEAREATLKHELRAVEQEHALQSLHLEVARQSTGDKEAELARLAADLATRSKIAEQQNAELARVRADVEALKAAAIDDERERIALNARLARAHEELTAAGRQLADERRKAEDIAQEHTAKSTLLDEARAALHAKEQELARAAADLVTGAAVIEQQDLELARARTEVEALRLAVEEEERAREALNVRIARHGDESDVAGRYLAEARSRMGHIEQDRARISALLDETAWTLREKEAALAQLAADFAAGAGIIEQQDLEIAAARADAEAFRLAAEEAERERDALSARLARHGEEADPADRQLTKQHVTAEDFGPRIADLKAELTAQREAADALAQLTAARIGEQVCRLAEHEYEAERLQGALEAAHRAEAGLRWQLTQVEERRMLESKAALAEKAALEMQVARLQLDREQLQLEAATGTYANGATNGHAAPAEPHVVRLEPIAMRERRSREESAPPQPSPS